MYRQLEKQKKNKNNKAPQKNNSVSAFQFVDNRPEAVTQKKLKKKIYSKKTQQLKKSADQTSVMTNTSQNVMQLMRPDELRALADQQEKLMTELSPPTSGMFVWKVLLPNQAELYILGTHHGVKFQDIHQSSNLFNFLTDTHWDAVYTEKGESGVKFNHELDLLRKLLQIEADVRSTPNQTPAIRLKALTIEGYEEAESAFSNPIFDEVASRLALRIEEEEEEKKEKYSIALETEDDRTAATKINQSDRRRYLAQSLYTENLDSLKKRKFGDNKTYTIKNAYIHGNEYKIWEFQQESLRKGRDLDDIEQRNNKWINDQREILQDFNHDAKILWIVGASHVPGLLVRLKDFFPDIQISSVGGDFNVEDTRMERHPYGFPLTESIALPYSPLPRKESVISQDE